MIADFNMKTEDEKDLPAVKVISEVLKYFKSKFFKCYKSFSEQKDVKVPTIKNIKWILTVPAIWSLAARQIMKDAATLVCCSTKFNEQCTIFLHTVHSS